MTPEQEEQVRRALVAAARQDEPSPMPADVVSRLDEVLADLRGSRVTAAVDEGRTGATEGPSADEPTPRRRRRPKVLVAAAAVSVIGFAGAAVATHGFSVGGAADSSSAGSGPDPQSVHASPGPQEKRSLVAEPPAAPQLHSSTLARDVQRVVDGESTGDLSSGQDDSRRDLLRGTPDHRCATPVVRAGERLVAVRLDGRPATLLLGTPTDGRRTAQVFSCAGATRPVATTMVSTR